MTKNQFKSLLTENVNHPETIHGIFNWCDRWCERCSKTENCTVYKTSTRLPSDNPDDFFKSLSMMFDATIDMMKKFQEDEDEILAILICLQKLGKKVEQLFPDARTFSCHATLTATLSAACT